MKGGGQLRLLLWRDYLIRKRKFITLAGILWATGIMLCIYTVRMNIDNKDVPTCQYPARALPSAGVVPFLQSFVCSVNNECHTMDRFEEIPSYQAAKLTQLKDKLAPVFNTTVLELAGTAPAAARLLATLAAVADDPDFIHFSKNGLKFKDLFNNPSRVKRYLMSHMQLDDDVAQSLMMADISFQGVLNGSLDRCSAASLRQTLVLREGPLQTLAGRLCALTQHDIQGMVAHLIYEINFTKYIKMLGNMYARLTGDDRISGLGDFVTALLRMTRLQNFLPVEARALFYGHGGGFTYFDLDLIKKFVELFEPTFGDTAEYQTIREFADTAVTGLRYLYKIFGNVSNDADHIDVVNMDSLDVGLNKINKVLGNAMEITTESGETIDPFNVLTKLVSIVYKFLPTYKHDILFYSTLLAKLMESAQRVIDINMHIQDITYNVTLRNSEAINAVKRLPPAVVGKTFDALVDAERTQILTAKLTDPGQMFCDAGKLQAFLLVSRTEADAVRDQLCTDEWKNYVDDLIRSFGVFEVKDSINEMASLLIQETIGKDTSSQLYSIEKDFQILRNFTTALVSMDSKEQQELEWGALLGVAEGDELMKVVNEKAHLGKLMLISVHGAIAKEIVKQNAILQYKLMPILLNTDALITALNYQLDIVPEYVTEGVKQVYADLVMTLVMTANDEEKTFKTLSTYCEDIFCHGGDNAAMYLQFPTGVDVDKLAEVLCNASVVIEGGLKNDSIISKAIANISDTTHTVLVEVNWTKLINNIQKLYVKLDNDYPYVFEYSTYTMDNVTQAKVKEIYDNSKENWFGIRNLQRGLQLSVNLGFRLLNVMDHGMFNMTSETWMKMKFFFTKTVGPLTVIDDAIQLVTGLITNSSYTSGLPPKTAEAVRVIIPNLPELIVDAVNIIIHDDTDIVPIISILNASPPWPCGGSLSDLLELTSSSKSAVRALEQLLCLEPAMQDEWTHYLKARGIYMNNTLSWNTTEYSPHLFLGASSSFNALISDAGRVRAAFEGVQRGEDAGGPGGLGLKEAWNYAVTAADSPQGNEMIGKFFSKFDTVVNSIETSVNTNISLNALWESYVKCTGEGYIEGCGAGGRALFKKALQVLSVIFEAITDDMTIYFTEVNAPDYNLLQLVGFTKNTTLYMLYDKLPEFLGVLINSYFDYGFMSQVRRASQSRFWDCEALTAALTPWPGSTVQMAQLRRVQPYLCPSFIYWISLPRDDNLLFNVVAKPQYYFYSYPVENATSSFEKAFTKGVYLADFITSINIQNKTALKNEVEIDNTRDKLTNFVDKVLNYRLNETDERYKVFSDINKKQFTSQIYLTRVVAIVNKLGSAIDNLTVDEEFIAKANIDQENVAKITADLAIMKNVFKRRAVDSIALHYDVLTDLLWRNDDSYTLIDAVDAVCDDLKQNRTRSIVVDEIRTKAQICAKNYRVLYGAVVNEVIGDYDDARQSLINLVKTQSGDDNVTDVIEFLSNRSELVDSLKHSIKFSYDLGLPIYLKYLRSNLQGYRVLLSFLSGGDWWEGLRTLYSGPEAKRFFGILEQVFEVVNNLLNNLDGVHLVRLIRDIRAHDSDACVNTTLSDYIPDALGALSALHQQVCTADKVQLFAELPPMLFANQGYESSLKLSKEVDYTSLNTDITNIESNIGLIAEGPREPLRPSWVTDDKLKQFKSDVVNILSTETLTKITFGALSNAVDAGTLFLNNSECVRCSQITSWSKQLNLQLYKKQEYDNLLCHLQAMSLDDVYLSLKNDFHWDMLIRELISSRNYTSYELNKSLNEFLGLVEVHLLDDLRAPTTKLTECLANNVTRNAFGNATLFLQVLAHTARLLRAEAPHVHRVEGVTDLPYLTDLFTHVAHTLAVYRPLRHYTEGTVQLGGVVADDEVALDIMEADLNLLAANNGTEDIEDLIRLRTNKWRHVCEEHDCGDIFSAVRDSLDLDKIAAELPGLQNSEFWQLSFASSALSHVERLLSHVSRLSGAASMLDAGGAAAGRLSAVLDVLATVLMDDTVDSILFSLEGISEELQPLLKGAALGGDLVALGGGLRYLHQIKVYLLEEVDLNLRVAQFFPDTEAVEAGLSRLGINNTNFWSLAAPRIHAGHIQMKPVLSSKERPFHISSFMCDIELMSQVLAPQTDVVSAEEVAAATVEQFCDLDEDIAKEMLMVLMANADFTPIIDKVKEFLLSKLYSASELSPEQGSAVVSRLPRLVAALPPLQTSLGAVMEDLANEPLLQDLKDFSSVGKLMSSSDFLGNAGRMICGAPFGGAVPRLLGNILRAADMAVAPSDAQLAALPTEFCRDMYKEIISMEGGKIMWSFVKPLLMGKILYTPDIPRTHRIIHQANASFASMIQLSSLVHSLSSAVPSLEGMSVHRAGIAALQALLAGEGVAPLRTQLLGDVEIDVDVDAWFSKFDLKSVGKLMSKASDLLHCFNMDRFVSTRNETTLMHEAAALSQVNEFSAGIVFLNAEELDNTFSTVQYKIRMDIENSPSTARRAELLWTPGPDGSFVEHMRYFRGFIQIQDMLDKAIIQLASNASKHSRTKRQSTEHPSETLEGSRTETELDWALYTQQEPYPCYRMDTFQSSLYESQALLVGFFFALLFSVSSIVRFLVADKESGNTMLMSVMGVELRWHTLSWALASAGELATAALAATAVLVGGRVLPRTDPLLLFSVIMLYFLSVLSFCYLMSKLFSSASFAAVCSSITYLITFLPFVFILSLELLMNRALKLLVCLSMSSSFCYALLFLTRKEATGRGAGWGDAGTALTEDSMSLAAAMGMVALDALLYLAAGWALDRYCGIRSISSSIITSAAQTDKAGVSIVKVSKTYSPGTHRAKVALENVSMELHKGQITTLLGHNGAGKTTLTNILTGMLRPSSGHVVVRGGARVGVCPQRDVLVECLTAREHLTLYARLAGDGGDQREEIDRMVSVLSLGGVSDRLVSVLSGGTRRRVCVALAFVGRPQLVSLDEPTAGVDPAARREIWDMIVKLKEDCTILLTTHHLDEAELLSDQIIIMHKGKVHTSGTPIEIKRSLGSGYKLSVQLPGGGGWGAEGGGWGAEERAKAVTGAVRGVVKNAQVVDIGGSLEMLLPFCDEDGASNNFLQLCSTLEQQQTELGFTSYTLDCSTLEQVFSDICLRADTAQQDPAVVEVCDSPKPPSKSGSSSSVQSVSSLVWCGGARRGTRPQQLRALLRARYLHLIRNRWLLFMLVGLPTVFVLFSMGMSQLRPPPFEEISLKLSDQLYGDTTHYLVPNPSVHSDIDPRFAEQVMALLQNDKHTKTWTEKDTPICKCMDTHQLCNIDGNTTRPEMMVLPDVDTLNTWIVNSHEIYLEKRYGGYSATIRNNKTNLIAWYNNKGFHAMTSFLNTLNNAILRTLTGTNGTITTYSHPLKISEEQLSKDTVYQRIADAGVCALVLVAFSAAAAGGAVPLVAARQSKEKRLQLLSGVSPAAYWGSALLADMAIMLMNMLLTALVMLAFGLPIFVDRNNLPAICILFILSGFACSCMVHVLEKLFSSASLANMMVFTGNSFLGLGGLTTLLILDLISESDATDNARWVLHKIFMLSPQFALVDGMLEIAKNTIQAQVLYRFGMDTYKDPLTSDLIALHVFSLIAVGTSLLLLNLAIEYGYFDALISRWHRVHAPEPRTPQSADVSAERRRVLASLADTHDRPLSLSTIGNINRGFVHTEGQKNSLQRSVSTRDVAACVSLSKVWRGQTRPALADLTLGIAPGQCTALLGENGAGKSTTFSLLSGELRPSRGRVMLDGRARAPRGLCRGLVSYCPQSNAIDPLLTVRETLQLYCRLRGIDDEDDVIERTLVMCDLNKYAAVRAGALSGGNKRKLCAALAFMARTPLVLLDEPTSGMDPVSRECVRRGCDAAVRQRRGVLLSTHALDDARRAVSRVALLQRGRLVAVAPLQDCLNRFGGGYVVQCTTPHVAETWRDVTRRAPHATPRLRHAQALHFHLPTRTTVDGKEVITRVSDIFRLMAELQAVCDIRDYTVNQSSLDQMFLSFTDNSPFESAVDIEPLPTSLTHEAESLESITSL